MQDSRRPPYGYSVGLMTEYVAEMTGCLVMDPKPLSASFCTSLYCLLEYTKLPGATVLLGLAYLSKRIQIRPLATGPARPAVSEDEAWKMLAVAMMLGSKYLDDGTYTNTSWADVSGIPKTDLDRLEREWLGAVHWSLYVDLDLDPAYSAWIASWQGWLVTKSIQMTQNVTAAWLPVCESPPYAPGMVESHIFFSINQGAGRHSIDKSRPPTPLNRGMRPSTPVSVRCPMWPSTPSSISNATSFSWSGGGLLGNLEGPASVFT
jgi:hypothetical protein